MFQNQAGRPTLIGTNLTRRKPRRESAKPLQDMHRWLTLAERAAPSLSHPFAGPIMAIAGLVAQAPEFLDDRGHNPRVSRLDYGGKNRCDLAVTANKIFMKVPSRGIQRPLRRRPFVEWMSARPPDQRLGGQREGDAIFLMRRMTDLRRTARLLAAEIVGRHAATMSRPWSRKRVHSCRPAYWGV
jgi:hypothetical protein